MKTCQIMVYGGKHNWIDLTLRKDPNIKRLIFIVVEPEKPFPEHWEDLSDKIEQLESQQQDFPESEKIKYSYLNIQFKNDMVRLVRYFRALISILSELNYEIICNLTAGIFELRIALYLACQIESDKIKEIFYLNKQNFSKNTLFKTIQISTKGKNVLKIMFDELNKTTTEKREDIHNIEYNLSELHNICNKNNFKIDMPALSRLVSKLIKEGYLKERREGRLKHLSLTDIGLVFCPVYNYLNDIQEKLTIDD